MAEIANNALDLITNEMKVLVRGSTLRARLKEKAYRIIDQSITDGLVIQYTRADITDGLVILRANAYNAGMNFYYGATRPNVNTLCEKLNDDEVELNLLEFTKQLASVDMVEGYNSRPDVFQLSPLHVAAYLGRVDIVKQELVRMSRSGKIVVESNPVDLMEQTPAFTAVFGSAKQGQVREDEALGPQALALEHLCNHAVDLSVDEKTNAKHLKAVIDRHDRAGFYPIHYACALGSVDCLEVLTRFGADVNVTCKDGMTPLHYACKENQSEIVQKLVLDKNINLFCEDSKGEKAIDVATKYGSPVDCGKILLKAIVQVLIDRDKINIPLSSGSKTGLYPIHHACVLGDVECLETLLLNNADINKTTAQGITPLHEAVRHNQHLAVKKLVESGASLCELYAGELMHGVSPLALSLLLGRDSCSKVLHNARAPCLISACQKTLVTTKIEGLVNQSMFTRVF